VTHPLDAVLFDAGGVLVLPDPTVIAPLLAPYGGDPSLDRHCRAHYAATGGRLVLWFENGQTVYGFKTAEQAAAFKHWIDTCGIDWTKGPRDGPIPDFVKSPERPTRAHEGYRGHSGGPSPPGRGSGTG